MISIYFQKIKVDLLLTNQTNKLIMIDTPYREIIRAGDECIAGVWITL